MYYFLGVLLAVVCALVPPVAFIIGAAILAITVAFIFSIVYYRVREWLNPW